MARTEAENPVSRPFRGPTDEPMTVRMHELEQRGVTQATRMSAIERDHFDMKKTFQASEKVKSSRSMDGLQEALSRIEKLESDFASMRTVLMELRSRVVKRG